MFVLDDALVHEQGQNFIRGEEGKSDRGRGSGVEGSGGGGEEVGRKGEGNGYPLPLSPPPPPPNKRIVRALSSHQIQSVLKAPKS